MPSGKLSADYADDTDFMSKKFQNESTPSAKSADYSIYSKIKMFFIGFRIDRTFPAQMIAIRGKYSVEFP